MSMRCNIHFTDGVAVRANVYHPCDGYPDGPHGVPAGLAKFFAAVKEQAPDGTRFSDPECLAAKYIVWQALQYTTKRGKPPLHFIGVSPCLVDYADIRWVYTVDCGGGGEEPAVTWKEAQRG